MAIVHIAMFDTVNAVVQEYESYTGVRAPSGALSMPAAISQAAHNSLAALFPSQVDSFDARLAEDLDAIKNKKAKINGVALGQRAAAAILALKANDGSQHAEPRVGVEHVTSDLPGHWRQDPIRIPRSFSSLSQAEEENAQSRIYLGIHWSFDKRSITQGNRIADYVFEHTFTPLQRDGR